jgi:hypothetical protein
LVVREERGVSRWINQNAGEECGQE